eukprot:COSAG02_NODE_673_length_18630_cov_7.960768_2_plen_111_part_00
MSDALDLRRRMHPHDCVAQHGLRRHFAAIVLSVGICAQTIALMGFVEQYANSRRDIGQPSKHSIGIGYGMLPLVDALPLTCLLRQQPAAHRATIYLEFSRTFNSTCLHEI